MVLSSYLTSDPKMLVCAARPHARTIERVVGIGFQPGLDPAILQSEHLGVRYVKSYLLLLGCLTAFLHILSASEAGEIQFLDMRNGNHVYLTIDAHRGSLTALAVQQHAPLIASGSAKQFIKVFSLEGSQRCTIRFNPTSIARKIGPVSHLTFHPYQVLLAAGAADALVSIYGFISEAAAKCPLTYIEISPKSLHFGSPGVSRSAAPIPLHTQCFWKCCLCMLC